MELELQTKIENSVAVVYFKGLGFVCFNENQVETLFIHADKHNLEINIYRPVSWEEYQNSNPDDRTEFNGVTYLLLETITKTDFITNEVFGLHPQLSIEINNGSNTNGFEKWAKSDFIRSQENDKNDLGWLVDLKKDGLFPAKAAPKANSNYPRSIMKLNNCLVYTAQLVTEMEDNVETEVEFQKIVDVQNMKNAEPSDLKEESFGKMADTLGAIINGNSVKIKLKCGNETRQFFFGKLNQPYVITITNDGDEQSSDMGIYREFWENLGLEKFDLVNNEELAQIKKDMAKPIGVRKTCNLVTAEGTDSIDSFLFDSSARAEGE